MLHVLQYLTGTSIAATSDVASLIMTQSFVGGPIAKGSSDGSGGGMGWRFRGIICELMLVRNLKEFGNPYSGINERSMYERREAHIEEIGKYNRDRG